MHTILYQILFRSNKTHQNSSFVMIKVVCHINMEAVIVGFLGGSVMKVGIYGVVKKKRETSGFGLQVMLGGSLCVSGPCILQLYCGTTSKLA